MSSVERKSQLRRVTEIVGELEEKEKIVAVIFMGAFLNIFIPSLAPAVDPAGWLAIYIGGQVGHMGTRFTLEVMSYFLD